MKKVGAPSTYTKALGDKICEYIVEGKSLREIQRIEDMPAMTTMINCHD
jgi:hypothetical protein